MQRATDGDSAARLKSCTLSRLQTDDYSLLGHTDLLPSPASSTGTPVFAATTPPAGTPPPSSMSGMHLIGPEMVNRTIDSWVAITPNGSDDEQLPRLLHQRLAHPIMASDLALAVEGLRIHEHEESFSSEGEDEEDEDLSMPPSEDSSAEEEGEEDLAESSDEETILAPRTAASLARPVSDEALRARCFPAIHVSDVVFLHSSNLKMHRHRLSMNYHLLGERLHKHLWAWNLFL
jgi:hypothetical protein